MSGRTRDIGVSLSPEKSSFGPLLFAGDLPRGMECAKQLGYDGVEISVLDSAKIDREELLRGLERLKLRVFALATGQTYYTDGFSLYDAAEDKRVRAVERIFGAIDLARELDCKVILGGIRGTIKGPQESVEALRARGARAIGECAEYGRERGVELLLEPINRYETNVVNTLKDGAELIAQLGARNVTLLPDTFHMNIEESDIPKNLAQAGGLVGYVHVADSNRWAPGFGHIPFAPILKQLNAMGYCGPIGVEVLPKPTSYEAAVQAIRELRALMEDGGGADPRGAEQPARA